jgi:hypothetical protein
MTRPKGSQAEVVDRMPVDMIRLQAILDIGHAASIRGASLSLREALRVAGYVDHRASFAAADLQPIIAAQPVLVEQWLSYSEDKRTTAGWYIARHGEIGRIL